MVDSAAEAFAAARSSPEKRWARALTKATASENASGRRPEGVQEPIGKGEGYDRHEEPRRHVLKEIGR